MKGKLIALAIALGLAMNTTAQVPISSKIEKVTVFVSGAQITRTAPVELKAGTTQLVLSGLSPDINPQSISAGFNNDVTILSVTQSIDYLNQQAKTEEITKLQSQRKLLQDKVTVEQNKITILQQEENLLRENQKLGSQNAGVKIVELREAADFFRSRLTEISNLKLASQNSIAQLNQEIGKITQQLQELNAQLDQPTGVIRLMVSANNAITSKLTISYLVSQASWTPYYDLRIKDINNPVTFGYRATVVQNCGENWDKVKLVLSSGNPSRNGVKPEINPWYLSFYQPAPLPMRMMNAKADRVALDKMADAEIMMETDENMPMESKKMTQQSAPSAPPSNLRNNETTAEFEVADLSTIPSDNNPYNVSIADFTLPATYTYQSVPKLDKAVFLSAGITGWEAYSLQDGEANLYFEGTYVGSTTLSTRDASDTVNISLGRDNGISINREKEKDFSSTQMLSSQRKDTRTWVITVRNNKSQKADITVNDQIPLSTNSDITVEPGDLSGASYDDKTGLLTWTFTLQPKETKKITFSYSVKYPKKNRVILE